MRMKILHPSQRRTPIGDADPAQNALSMRPGWQMGNLRLASDGRFHMVDFGWGVTIIVHRGDLERGYVGYGLAMLLLSAHGVNIRPLARATPGYSQTQPCRCCMDPRLDALAVRHKWLSPVLEEVRQQPASALTQPEFYDRLGALLPDRVAAPRATTLVSRLFWSGGHVLSIIRRSVRELRSRLKATGEP